MCNSMGSSEIWDKYIIPQLSGVWGQIYGAKPSEISISKSGISVSQIFTSISTHAIPS